MDNKIPFMDDFPSVCEQPPFIGEFPATFDATGWYVHSDDFWGCIAKAVIMFFLGQEFFKFQI